MTTELDRCERAVRDLEHAVGLEPKMSSTIEERAQRALDAALPIMYNDKANARWAAVNAALIALDKAVR